MRLARTVLLLLSLALAWAAVALLGSLSLDELYPAWLLRRAPNLAYSLQWLPADVRTIGVWLALLASLLFGIAIPTWIGISSRRLEVQSGPQRAPGSPLAFLLCTAGVLLIALVVAATTPAPTITLNGWLRTALWLGASALALLAARLAQAGRLRRVVGDDGGAPERSWPWLLGVLAVAAFLFVWQNGRVPVALPDASALIGLQAEQTLAQLDTGLLEPGRAGLPQLATLLTAVTMSLSRTPLGGLAWSGLIAGLALVAATWLFGCELFRRTRLHDGDGDLLDDDGRMPALWAALALAAALPIIHHARLPLALEPVVWGVLGLWALLRGARRGRFGWLVLSGLLLGLAVISHGSGLLFAAVAALVWLGLGLLRRRWLRSELGGVGWKGLLLWAVSFAAAAAPAVCLYACGAQSDLAGWLRGFGNLGPTMLGLRSAVEWLGLPLDAVAAGGPDFVAWGLLLAPLLLLGFAGLLFQIDQVVGWTGAGWLLLALITAAPLADSAARPLLLLGALPAAALAIAFALDRVRATLTRAMGGWVHGAASLLAGGLLVVAALVAWRSYPALAGVQNASTSTAGVLARAVAPAAAANPTQAQVLLLAGDALTWEHPALQLAVRETGDQPLRLTLAAGDAATWPATLPAQARIYALPAEAAALQQLAARYPGGVYRMRRDLRGNPLVYIYQLP